MIFEYSPLHKDLTFLAIAHKDVQLSSGSIKFGIFDTDGNELVSNIIPVNNGAPTQVSGSIALSSLNLIEGQSYKSFYSLIAESSGSYVNADGSPNLLNNNLYMSQPVVSTTLDEDIAATSGSSILNLQSVTDVGHITTNPIVCNDLISTGTTIVGNGQSPAIAYWGGVLVSSLVYDGTNFTFDKPLIVTGALKSTSDVYVNSDGPNGDSNLYFYDAGSSTGQSIKWDDSETRIGFSSNVYYNGDITATWGLTGGVLKGGKGLWGQGNILADGNLYANFSGPNGNSFVYFYNTGTTGASLEFDNTAQEFKFSHTLQAPQPSTIALYPNTRIGDWAWSSTDSYLTETTTTVSLKYTYIYLSMPKYTTQINVDVFASITGA